MAYNSGKQLLLNALLKGLADATRRNDRSTAERYRRSLRLTAEQIAAEEPVQDGLKKLLLVSGLWVEAAEVDRDETTQQESVAGFAWLGPNHQPANAPEERFSVRCHNGSSPGAYVERLYTGVTVPKMLSLLVEASLPSIKEAESRSKVPRLYTPPPTPWPSLPPAPAAPPSA